MNAKVKNNIFVDREIYSLIKNKILYKDIDCLKFYSRYEEYIIKTIGLIELLNSILLDYLWEILKEKSSRYGNPHWKKLMIHLLK